MCQNWPINNFNHVLDASRTALEGHKMSIFKALLQECYVFFRENINLINNSLPSKRNVHNYSELPMTVY